MRAFQHPLIFPIPLPRHSYIRPAPGVGPRGGPPPMWFRSPPHHKFHTLPHTLHLPPSMNMKLKVAPILMVPYEGEPSLYCCTTRLCRTVSTLRFIELVRS